MAFINSSFRFPQSDFCIVEGKPAPKPAEQSKAKKEDNKKDSKPADKRVAAPGPGRSRNLSWPCDLPQSALWLSLKSRLHGRWKLRKAEKWLFFFSSIP